MNWFYLNPGYWWRRHHRTFDRCFLFPQIQKLADKNKSPVAGAGALLAHVQIDSAWQYPGEFTDAERELVEAAVHIAGNVP